MSQIPNVLYHIQKPGGSFIAFLGAAEGAPAVLLPASSPKDQEWRAQRSPDGGYTFKNAQTGKFLGFKGPPHVNEPIIATDEPKGWELRQSNEPSTFFLVVPGGPVDGDELIVDLSTILIEPPRLALRPWHSDNNTAAWQLQPSEIHH
ncbi:carbohydrate-binding module family 13 protein [Botryobasidium botryosum FD-172 SS1]|uniref:Carbohydrate-binding module family 13 protein n=1 Tax=Botryobasidium botryosum (strain FD-172 SS1) TaxID=930990 RepID=A0A067MA75_BOTB1|nr:carbohydrate-binding module family 13 protein [Botryobasidium botryosum FD-172 SS1]